ncbi:2,3-diaminopropionate biosynthesis protein SbnA [Pendulispora brunnea]|uniref:2,3-diaminopropionate biosynthesis protein SbnA n=1 Tax=Pendulispora brunnea TaxID=2905690 RepID=A0ABZ2KA63_9BACT
MDLIGRAFLRPSPIVPLDFAAANLRAKLEFCNPIGSIKDKPAFWIVKSAIERGIVDEKTTIVESSSGNFAIALAVLCRHLGLRFIPVIDPNISALNEMCLRNLCREVVKVSVRDDTGGFLKTRIAKVKELCGEIPNSFWTEQYGNLDGMAGHYHLTGGQICAHVKNLDYVFLGVSSGGTIAGVSTRLKERFKHVQVIAVDVVGSVIFGGPPRKRYIPGIGASIVPELVGKAAIDRVVMVSETETLQGCRELFARDGVFAGGSSGSVYAAIKKTLGNGKIHAKPDVLFLCCDRGTSYLDTVYNDEWCARLIRDATLQGAKSLTS